MAVVTVVAMAVAVVMAVVMAVVTAVLMAVAVVMVMVVEMVTQIQVAVWADPPGLEFASEVDAGAETDLMHTEDELGATSACNGEGGSWFEIGNAAAPAQEGFNLVKLNVTANPAGLSLSVSPTEGSSAMREVRVLLDGYPNPQARPIFRLALVLISTVNASQERYLFGKSAGSDGGGSDGGGSDGGDGGDGGGGDNSGGDGGGGGGVGGGSDWGGRQRLSRGRAGDGGSREAQHRRVWTGAQYEEEGVQLIQNEGLASEATQVGKVQGRRDPGASDVSGANGKNGANAAAIVEHALERDAASGADQQDALRLSASAWVRPDEEVFMVVSVTQQFTTPVLCSRSPSAITRFPWRVKLEGAVPLAWPGQQQSVAGAAHANGGGFVAATAHVDASAYVGPRARVLDSAFVRDSARVEGAATVKGSSVVSDRAVVRNHAVISSARVGDDALIADFASVYDGSSVMGNGRVLEERCVHYGEHVEEEGVSMGVFSSTTGALINGSAKIVMHAELHQPRYSSGVYSGYSNHLLSCDCGKPKCGWTGYGCGCASDCGEHRNETCTCLAAGGVCTADGGCDFGDWFANYSAPNVTSGRLLDAFLTNDGIVEGYVEQLAPSGIRFGDCVEARLSSVGASWSQDANAAKNRLVDRAGVDPTGADGEDEAEYGDGAGGGAGGDGSGGAGGHDGGGGRVDSSGRSDNGDVQGHVRGGFRSGGGTLGATVNASGAVRLPSTVASARDVMVEMRIRWFGGIKPQIVFECANPSTNSTFRFRPNGGPGATPNLAVVLHGALHASVSSKTAIHASSTDEVRVRFAKRGNTLSLTVSGETVRADANGFDVSHLDAAACWIGGRASAHAGFRGDVLSLGIRHPKPQLQQRPPPVPASGATGGLHSIAAAVA
eukprot:3274242-Pleurochrysis_carterae.AAC.1